MRASSFFIVGIAGTELSGLEKDLFRRSPPGGIVLFARNIATETQLHALIGDIRGRLPDAVVCVDQEGGPVDRFRAITGSSLSFASASGSGRAALAGRLAGEICAAFSIDWNLAPVVDRAVEGAGRSILKARAASQDPEDVARAAGEFLRGLEVFGVAGCLKHFPGLGRATVDSHDVLPRLEIDRGELVKDLAPFRALAGHVPAIMISHAATGEGRLPATLDPAVASDLLRADVAFSGVSISDDLEMGALAEFGGIEDRATAAFVAGCDYLCIGKQNDALAGAIAAVEQSASNPRRDEAAARIARFHGTLARLKKERRATPRPVEEIAAAFREAMESIG